MFLLVRRNGKRHKMTKGGKKRKHTQDLSLGHLSEIIREAMREKAGAPIFEVSTLLHQ